jgi:hypothetical protein
MLREATMRCDGAIGGLLLALAVLPGMARADGGIFMDTEAVGKARTDGQQAILFHFDDAQTLVLQTEYKGELAEFAWLIPVPSRVEDGDVREADPAIFGWFGRRTAPTYYTRSFDGGDGCHCPLPLAGSTMDYDVAGDRVDEGQGTTAEIDTIVTESYVIHVLTTEDPDALRQWLDDNGYARPLSSDAVFQHYFDHGWFFLAVEINPSAHGELVEVALPALQLDVTVIDPVFPLLISSVSSEPEAEILIHVVSDSRVTTQDVVSETPNEFVHDCDMSGDDFDALYGECLKQQVRDRDGELYAVEFADVMVGDDCDAINGFLGASFLDAARQPWLTRFHTWYMPALYPDDAWFRADTSSESYRAEIEVYPSEALASRRGIRWSAGGMGVLAALLLAWRRLGVARVMV